MIDTIKNIIEKKFSETAKQMNKSEKMLKHIKEIVCEQFEDNKLVDFYQQEFDSEDGQIDESSSYYTSSEEYDQSDSEVLEIGYGMLGILEDEAEQDGSYEDSNSNLYTDSGEYEEEDSSEGIKYEEDFEQKLKEEKEAKNEPIEVKLDDGQEAKSPEGSEEFNNDEKIIENIENDENNENQEIN